MKRNEAIELGYNYTGMSASEWDSEKWDNYKKRAQEIRKNYRGADYRVVTERQLGRYGSSIWKSIYANAIFLKVMYFDEEREFEYLSKHEERLAAIKARYEELIQEENKKFSERKNDFEEILELKK